MVSRVTRSLPRISIFSTRSWPTRAKGRNRGTRSQTNFFISLSLYHITALFPSSGAGRTESVPGPCTLLKTAAGSNAFQPPALPDIDFAAEGGHLLVVGDEEQREPPPDMEVLDQAHDGLSRFPVQVPGGPVTQKKLRGCDRAPA